MKLSIDRTWDGAPLPAAEVATVFLSADAGGLVVDVVAPFFGDPAPAEPPGPTWALWEHEVVELFVLGADDRYLELELGPFGHHLLLRLEGRRNIVEKLLPLDVVTTRLATHWSATARLPAGLIPAGPHRVNATAIRGVGAGRRYAVAEPMPGPQPDFHRLEAFRPVVLPVAVGRR